MPELPEVESVRRVLARELKNKKIKNVFVSAKDFIVFDQASPQKVKKALQGATVTGVGRKGKYFWLELNRRPWVVIHFGMTGNAALLREHAFRKIWDVEEQDAVAWQKKKNKKVEKLPLYCVLKIEFADGTQVAFTDPRRFGRIRLANDPLTEEPISSLGPDPLEEFPSTAQLEKILCARKAPIKSVLLDQSVFAGVGNWIADEILFQSHISPHRRCDSLSKMDIKKLREKTLSIIRNSVKLDANYKRYPDDWLFHDRWSKGTEAYTSRGYEIKHDTIGGRTTAWVPALQS